MRLPTSSLTAGLCLLLAGTSLVGASVNAAPRDPANPDGAPLTSGEAPATRQPMPAGVGERLEPNSNRDEAIERPAWGEGDSDDAQVQRWHRVVGILQYLTADYPLAVATGSELELEEQRTFARLVVELIEESGAEGAPYLERARRLEAGILAGGAPEEISPAADALGRSLIEHEGLAQSPASAPDLGRGARLYVQLCVLCHGANGRADTFAARQLDPAPANFHDPERMAEMTPYQAYNTISFGVPGTGMPSFETIGEADRWALAFHLFTLRHDECRGEIPSVSLTDLATFSDAELARRHGEDALPCVRTSAVLPDLTRGLRRALDSVRTARDAVVDGDTPAALDALVAGYLEGIEPVEPFLAGRDPQGVPKLEAAFLEATRLVRARSPEAPAALERLEALLAALDQPSPEGAWAIATMAAFIFLREGFEVLLVLFALLAVLKRSNRPDAARWVHAGWVCAVLVGALLFLVARGLIDGSNRAWLEAVTSLAAVGMLLYAALWLNRMAGVRENMGHLRSGADRALREGRLSGLFAVSFLAAFREAFETTLFLQALALDAPGATALGALAGVVLLGVAVFFVSRVGFRLPMKQLFSLSTLLLIATALVLLGKGLHELQLLGILASVPFPGPTFGLLGLYPDAVTLGAQLALGLLAFVWVRLVRARG